MAGLKRVHCVFYRTPAGAEVVRDWFLALSKEDRTRIGEDLKTIEYGWPIGMPVCRPLGKGLFEARSELAGNRAARVLFFVREGRMFVVACFIKKTPRTPPEEMALALRRKREMEEVP